jgi:hypothetical protein
MSVFEKDFLERVKSREASAKAQECNAQSQNISLQKKAGQPDSVEKLVKKARAAGHAGPLVVGPSRSSLKGSWRDDARILEELYPEDFGPPRNQPSEIEAPLEPQPLAPAPAPMEPLPSSFWWSLLFGNPDSLVSSSNATQALHLVSDNLAIPIGGGERIDALRAGQLRKLLRDRFGPIEAEQTFVRLWRAAPREPRTPQPNENQSQLAPGPLPVSRNQPWWIGELNEPGGTEREWLVQNGLWCG